MDKKEKFNFPKDFFWGTSTSAYQIEGGIKNDWSEWEKKNASMFSKEARDYFADWQKKKFPQMLTAENYICGKACDSYNRYEEDLLLNKKLNCNAFRMGIEWSRVEPNEGEFDEEAIKRYKKIIRFAKENDIEIMLTLWHWTNPLWIRNIGAWENKKTVEYFLRYAEKIVNELGSEVNLWLPLNETNTFVGLAYIRPKFPPQKKNLFIARKVSANLNQANKMVYKLIHKKNKNAQVGISHYMIVNFPYQNKFINKFVVKIVDYYRNSFFLKKASGYFDFIGLQYYHTDHIDVDFKKEGIGWGPVKIKNPNKVLTDLGWDIYPKGILKALREASKFKKPIYITENGLADADDSKREWFIKEHLKYVHKAIEDGIDVKGYFYWSLLDNFEWKEGWWPQFGLYEVDRKTLERKIRPSARAYAEICKNNFLEM